MPSTGPSAVLVRKRKRDHSRQTKAKSTTTSLHNPITANRQQLLPHGLRASQNDWTLEKQQHDSTSSEARSMATVIKGYFMSLFTKSVKSLIEPSEGLETIKKRRVDECKETPQDSSATPKTKESLKKAMTKKALLEADLQPALHPNKKEINFIKSPMDWDLQKTVQEEKSSSEKTKDYGTKFIRRGKKYNKQNIEAQYLRSIYSGQYRSPAPKDSSPPTPVNTVTSTISSLQENNFLKTIHALAENVKKDWASTSSKSSKDDVVFIKEVKIPPATPSGFSFRFDTTKVTFDEDFNFYQKLLNQKRLTTEKIHEEISAAKKPKSKLIKELTADEEEEVINIWKSRGKDNQLLLTANNVDVKVLDLKTLADKSWLNDVVIELYVKTLITDKIYAFNSYMFTTLQDRGYQGVQKWMKRAKVQIAKLDLILCPINVHQTHWVLGAINLKEKKILYLDSLATSKNHFSITAMDLLEDFLKGETRKQGVPELGQGFTKEHILNCPQQQNGYDCGVFTLLNSLYLSKNAELSYQPQEAAKFRRVIAHTILRLKK